MADVEQKQQPLWRKIGWFAGIWALSVLALGIVGGILKWILAA